ncbi:hypothetical protein J6590_021299 [Homalodisca vitripennis]|nr:hypothetical protein J6590_021299 [Homalodisca vitripennis]
MLAVCIVRRCIIRCGLIRIKNAHRLLSCDVTSRHYPTTNGPSWLARSPPPDTVIDNPHILQRRRGWDSGTSLTVATRKTTATVEYSDIVRKGNKHNRLRNFEVGERFDVLRITSKGSETELIIDDRWWWKERRLCLCPVAHPEILSGGYSKHRRVVGMESPLCWLRSALVFTKYIIGPPRDLNP